MWEHPRTQPVHTQSAVAQSHYSACYWPHSHSSAQHWISQPQPALLPPLGIDWLLDFLRCSSHTVSLLTLHCPHSAMLAVHLPWVSLPPHPVSPSFSLILSVAFTPPRYPLSRLSPHLTLSSLAMVTAFFRTTEKPYLAVCSAQPWQSCQFTCLDCCTLYPVSTTHRNYNPCISKSTWYSAMSDQHPILYTNLPVNV